MFPVSEKHLIVCTGVVSGGGVRYDSGEDGEYVKVDLGAEEEERRRQEDDEELEQQLEAVSNTHLITEQQ